MPEIEEVGEFPPGGAPNVVDQRAAPFAAASSSEEHAEEFVDAEEPQEDDGKGEAAEDELTEQERQEMLAAANAAKERGNTFFKAGDIDQAVECYTEAIDSAPPGAVELATYFANRAAAYAKVRSSSGRAGAVTLCARWARGYLAVSHPFTSSRQPAPLPCSAPRSLCVRRLGDTGSFRRTAPRRSRCSPTT